MSKITIAIDGYSSCGKSTIAKALAHKLGYVYVDTGSMYRAVTLFCLRKGFIKDNLPETDLVIQALNDIHLTFKYNHSTRASDTYLNEENVEKEIRQMEVSNNVSKISTIKEVRTRMTELQREMGKNKGVVMDGRDIGTTVFPNAELKIFMTADTEVRVQRRLDELNAKGQHVSFEQVKQNLLSRDHEDTHRKESPLTKAADAIILDNTDLNKEEQLEYVIKLMEDLRLTKEL